MSWGGCSVSAGFPLLSHLWPHLQPVLGDPSSNCQKLEITYHCSPKLLAVPAFPSLISIDLSALCSVLSSHWIFSFQTHHILTGSLYLTPVCLLLDHTPFFFLLHLRASFWRWQLTSEPCMTILIQPAYAMSCHVMSCLFFFLNNPWWVDHFPAEGHTSKTMESTICTWCDKKEWKLRREGADRGELEGVVVDKYFQKSTLHIILKELAIILKGRCFTNICWAELLSFQMLLGLITDRLFLLLGRKGVKITQVWGRISQVILNSHLLFIFVNVFVLSVRWIMFDLSPLLLAHSFPCQWMA